MAKPFYSLEEVCARLGKTDADVRGLVREGLLREFRDAGKVFFKADDVDKLAARPAAGSHDSGEITLEATDDEVPAIADAGSGTSLIGLAPVEEEAKPTKEDTVVSAKGINVLGEDELESDADPMAKTQISQSAVADQVRLDSGGTGSGLLDLTREADDTSLGAELLDEIYPGEEASAEHAAAKPTTKKEAAPIAAAAAAAPVEVLQPTLVVPAGEGAEGVFGGLLVTAMVLLTLAGSIGSAAVQGFLPSYATWLSNQFLYFLLGCVVLAGAAMGIGFALARAFGGVRRA